MLLPRIIPCLLLRGKGLVKGRQFKDHVYIGDPSNAVHIFNMKKADEIIFLDITATRENRIPDPILIQLVSNECQMPFGVGGGLKTVDSMRAMLNAGAEKVCLCSVAVENPEVVKEGARIFGNQCIMVSVDVKKSSRGNTEVYIHSGVKATGLDPVKHAVAMERLGAGELLVNSIDRDGSMKGYDVELIQQIADSVKIPVIACGGAGALKDFSEAIEDGRASAVAAGSIFVFHGPKRGVLISYPSDKELAGIRGE